LIHAHITILPTGEVIAKDPKAPETLLFVPSQLQLFLDLDGELRRKHYTLDLKRRYVPSGYEAFRRIWNLDTTVQYELAPLEPGPNGTHLKKAIPSVVLLPFGSAAAPTATSRQSAEEEDLIKRLLLRTAQQSLRASDNARAGYEAREAKRERAKLDRLRTLAMVGRREGHVGHGAPSRRKRQRQAS
ncbi:hypothetical protein FKP32DRAFT_1543930, partial [Trametes sanguinea]